MQIRRTFISIVSVILLPVACQTSDSNSTQHLKAEGALGPYSGSVFAGEYCFVSGKIGQRGGAFAIEVDTAIDAVAAELGRSGLSLSDVVSVTVYLTEMGRYAEFNEIYSSRFAEPWPARACVAVAALPGGARVELQVIARRPAGSASSLERHEP